MLLIRGPADVDGGACKGTIEKNAGTADFDLREMWMVPFGISYLLGSALSGEYGFPANFLFLLSGEKNSQFAEYVHDPLKTVIPHLEAAVNMHLSTLRQTYGKHIHGGALSRLGVGIFILDSSGRAMEHNEEADRRLKKSGNFRISRQRIQITSPARHQKLYKLIDAALQHCREKIPEPFMKAIRINLPGDFDIGIHVTTTTLGEWLQFGGPAVVVSVADFPPSSCFPPESIELGQWLGIHSTFHHQGNNAINHCD